MNCHFHSNSKNYYSFSYSRRRPGWCGPRVNYGYECSGRLFARDDTQPESGAELSGGGGGSGWGRPTRVERGGATSGGTSSTRVTGTPDRRGEAPACGNGRAPPTGAGASGRPPQRRVAPREGVPSRRTGRVGRVGVTVVGFGVRVGLGSLLSLRSLPRREGVPGDHHPCPVRPSCVGLPREPVQMRRGPLLLPHELPEPPVHPRRLPRQRQPLVELQLPCRQPQDTRSGFVSSIDTGDVSRETTGVHLGRGGKGGGCDREGGGVVGDSGGLGSRCTRPPVSGGTLGLSSGRHTEREGRIQRS